MLPEHKAGVLKEIDGVELDLFRLQSRLTNLRERLHREWGLGPSVEANGQPRQRRPKPSEERISETL